MVKQLADMEFFLAREEQRLKGSGIPIFLFGHSMVCRSQSLVDPIACRTVKETDEDTLYHAGRRRGPHILVPKRHRSA